MKTDLQEDRPIFLQIKETIEDDILSGRLLSNEKIPSTNELVAYYNINPVTVMKGVNLLSDEGLVYKKRGIGIFVHPDAREILLKKYRNVFFQEYVVGITQRSKQLDISKEELLKMIEQAWKGDDNDVDGM